MLLEVEELRYHKCKIQESYRQVVTPIHLLANILHPKYMGRGLSSKQQEQAKIVFLNKILLFYHNSTNSKPKQNHFKLRYSLVQMLYNLQCGGELSNLYNIQNISSFVTNILILCIIYITKLHLLSACMSAYLSGARIR